MMLPPREPQSGDKITANWARDVVRYMKAITPLPGPGVRIDRKPHGSVINGGGGGGGGGGGSSDFGCFKILKTEGLTITFTNCFCMVGGKFYALGSTIEEHENCETFTVDENTPVVTLRIDLSGTEFDYDMVGFETLTALAEQSIASPGYFFIPLYVFTVDEEKESVNRSIDLRNIPIAPTFEFDE